MSALWTAAAAAAATGGRAQNWAHVSGVSIDTRTLEPGDLFVALAGDARDGHAFVADALAKGAGAAMVTHVPEGVAPDAPLLVVGDTLDALWQLGAAGRARLSGRLVAVTGSVGKTTTKEMLRVMLAAQGKVHAAEKSYNNHWGVPLTLARMPVDTDWAVIEIGMNAPGEIAPLSRLARPHVAVVTTVAAVHLEAFGNVGGIADEKAQIMVGLEPGGVAVINRDMEWFERVAGHAGGHRVLDFGEAAEAVRIRALSLAETTSVLSLDFAGGSALLKIGAPGAHLAQNAACAMAAILGLGADPGRAAIALGRWSPAARRGERHLVAIGPGGMDGSVTLIDESYNANPASMRAALGVLAAAPVVDDIGRVARGRRIAFLGDMLELGLGAEALHAEIAGWPELARIDVVHCCGPLMRALHDALPRAKRGVWCEDGAALGARAPRAVDAGDVCMVKGSNAMGMSRVVDAILALGAPAAAGSAEEEG